MTATVNRYSTGEEIANSITHGLGLLLAIGGLGVLTAFAALKGNGWHVTSCSIYSAALILLFSASTLYHSFPFPRVKRLFRIFDHSAIFIMIAGTYTPFTLVNLRGPWGWTLFGVVWGVAVLGILLETLAMDRWPRLSLALYVVMGWAVVAAIKPMLQSVAPGGLILMLAGGLAYTVGIIFYAWKKMPYHHAVWHLFVLAGSILHFFAILFYVIPD